MPAILLSWFAFAAVLCSAEHASAATLSAPAVAASPDPWAPVRFLEGEWTGVAEGAPGVGTVHRSYQFILGYRFLHERNVSAHGPTQQRDSSEVHEHWSFMSFDRLRRKLVLRQFHQEGFVNQYVLDAEASTARRLVFVSEAFENLDGKWRAREIYDLVGADEFAETFELAEPGKELAVYSKSSFRRATNR